MTSLTIVIVLNGILLLTLSQAVLSLECYTCYRDASRNDPCGYNFNGKRVLREICSRDETVCAVEQFQYIAGEYGTIRSCATPDVCSKRQPGRFSCTTCNSNYCNTERVFWTVPEEE